jgi:hypothetical protein
VVGGVNVVLGGRVPPVVLGGRVVVDVATVVDVGGVWSLLEPPLATTTMMTTTMMSAATPRAIHPPRPFFWGR